MTDRFERVELESGVTPINVTRRETRRETLRYLKNGELWKYPRQVFMYLRMVLN